MKHSFNKKSLVLTISLALASIAAGSLVGCTNSESAEATLAKAQAAIDKQDGKTAEILLKNILQKDDSAKARALLGELYYKAGDFRSAEKELRRAIEMGADRNAVVPKLLASMLQLGENQKVIEDSVNLAVTSKEAKADTLTSIAKAQMSLAKPDLAQKALLEALTEKPDYLPAQVATITLKASKGDRKGANAEVDALLLKEPNSVEASILKGDLSLADGKLEPARLLYEKVLQLAPNDTLARAKLAAIYIDLNDFKKAGEQVDQLARLSSNSPGTFYLRALLDFRQGKFELARDSISAALKSSPDYLPAITLAGNIYLSLGSFETAERFARNVVERSPEALQGHRLLGATYLKMNAPERALQIAQAMIDKGANDSTLYAIAGEAALKLNDATKAASYFEKAAKLDPNDPTKRTGLALSRMASGDREKGFSDLEQAVDIDTKNYQADFALIMARVRDKQFDKANEAVGKLDKKLPNSAIPSNLRGLIALAQNDETTARKSFDAALKIDPTFFAAAANLANLDIKANKPEVAKKRFEDILAKDPKNSQAFIALARHAQRTGNNNKEAIDYLRKARAANPGAIPPVLALANFYLEVNEPKEAVPILQEALTANPDRTDLLDLLGSAFMRMNDYSQSMETYEKLLRISPKSPATLFRIGELKLLLKDDNGAIQSFKKVSELVPNSPEPRIAIASILTKNGKLDQAKVVVAELKKDLPNSAAGLVLEGDMAMLGNQPAEAAVSFRKALSVEKQISTGVKLHRSLLATGKSAEAATVLNDWFKVNPNDLQMRLYAGETELSQRRWKEAIDHYGVVLTLDPRQPIALNNTAWALAQQKNYPKAVTMAEQAYSVAPSSPPIIDTLGTILVDSGNVARGVELLKQAVSLAPRQAEYRLHLAEALLKNGDKSGAKQEVELVLKEVTSGPIADSAKALAAKL